MKILIAGASGFLGQIIQNTLAQHQLITLGRSKADIQVDISKDISKLPHVDLVVHAAGVAHKVPSNQRQHEELFLTNLAITNNLLASFDTKNTPKYFVFISSVAVYGADFGTMISEEAQLAATDAYGLSKIRSETLIQKWCAANGVACTILRLPLIAGPNPPGNLKSMINGIRKGYYFNIQGGSARKSIVLAEDVARIIPDAAKKGGVFNLTDGYHPSFFELSRHLAHQIGTSSPLSIPLWLARIVGRLGDKLGPKAPLNSVKVRKITSSLTFDDTKARQVLGWCPSAVLKRFTID